MSNYHRCCANRRYMKVYRDAQIRRNRAKSAAKRLDRALDNADGPVDASLVGLCSQMHAIANRRVVGPNWRKPRPGRRW